MFPLRRWTPRQLLLAWSAYWVGLATATLGPPIWRTMGVALPEQSKGSISAAFGDEGFTMSIVDAGVTVWSTVTPFSTIAFWIALPPLALWAMWLLTRPSRRRPVDAAGTDASPAELGPGSMDGVSHAHRDPIHERQDRS